MHVEGDEGILIMAWRNSIPVNNHDIQCSSAHWDPLILHGVNPTEKEIGRGAYGRIFEVDYEGTLCAAKVVHALLLQSAQGGHLQKIKDDFLSEYQI